MYLSFARKPDDAEPAAAARRAAAGASAASAAMAGKAPAGTPLVEEAFPRRRFFVRTGSDVEEADRPASDF